MRKIITVLMLSVLGGALLLTNVASAAPAPGKAQAAKIQRQKAKIQRLKQKLHAKKQVHKTHKQASHA